MSKLSLVIPTVGLLNTVACPEVDTALSTIQTWANGEIEGTNNLKAEGVTEANLDAATKTLLNTKSAFALSLVKKNEATFTIATGELVVMEKEGSEVKLPAATLNRIVGAYAAVNTTITIKAAVAKTIFGDFLSTAGETTITLAANQHVILQATGTNWVIMAGEPKREQKYAVTTATKAEAEAGIEPSASRLAFVTLSTTAAELLEVKIGGEAVMVSNAGTKVASFVVPPGQKWKAGVATTAGTLLL